MRLPPLPPPDQRFTEDRAAVAPVPAKEGSTSAPRTGVLRESRAKVAPIPAASPGQVVTAPWQPIAESVSVDPVPAASFTGSEPLGYVLWRPSACAVCRLTAYNDTYDMALDDGTTVDVVPCWAETERQAHGHL